MAKKGYRHQQASSFATKRHKDKNKQIKLTTKCKDCLTEKLKIYRSPEQIVVRLSLDIGIKISTETTYRFVLQDKAVGGELYKFLRHQHKKYHKRYGKNDYRDIIPNRVDIDDRPTVVNTRSSKGLKVYFLLS